MTACCVGWSGAVLLWEGLARILREKEGRRKEMVSRV